MFSGTEVHLLGPHYQHQVKIMSNWIHKLSRLLKVSKLNKNVTTMAIFSAYCMLFDSSVRKSEIHSTMIDKCVVEETTAISLKRMDYHEVKISPMQCLYCLLPSSAAPIPWSSCELIVAKNKLSQARAQSCHPASELHSIPV